MQYYPERVYPHGNSKRDEPFKTTTYSVRKEIKSLASKVKKGKEIIQYLTQRAGGFSKARTVAELPNSLNQIYDLSRKNKIKDTQNELLELIDSAMSDMAYLMLFYGRFTRFQS